MARKNLKVFRQNGHGPKQKGLRSPACGAELPRLGSKGRTLGGPPDYDPVALALRGG